MRTKIKGITSLVLSVAMLFSLFAVAPITANAAEDDLTFGDFTYELNSDGSCTIAGYEGKSSNVIIPSEIEGHKVTEIGMYAFNEDESIVSVTVPNGVTTVGMGAFDSCDKLTKVVLPDTVTYIDDFAFAYSSKLSDITLGENIDYVGMAAFDGTKWLDSQPKGIVYVGHVAYAYQGTMPFNTKLSIKSGTTRIADSAFFSCDNLVEVTLPQGLKTIGSSAFSYCVNLKSIDIPNGVETVGEEAFNCCDRLENITMPDSVRYVGTAAFDGAKWLIRQPDGMVYIGNVLYKYKGTMPKNTSVTLKDGTVCIAGNAFEGKENLVAIDIPDTAVYIGDYAFSECTNLRSVNLPANLEELGCNAFSQCSSLESITLPDKVKNIGDNCFWSCDSLKSVKLSESLENIYNSAFEFCESLESIVLPDSVKYVGISAFYACNKMKSISIGSGLDEIEMDFLGDCPALEKITVSADNKSFTSENGVLYNKDKTQIVVYPENKKDTEFTVPDTVTIIGYSEYTEENYICSPNLKTITVPKSVNSILYQSIGFVRDDENELVKVKDFTIKGYYTTQAEYYAKNIGFNFVPLDTRKNLPTPQITSLTNASNGIVIKWNAVEGAYGYRVYEKTSSGWKRIKDTPNTGTNDLNVTPNQTKTYTVRCIDMTGNTISGYNPIGWSIKYTPVAPSMTSLENSRYGIALNWNSVAGVYGYRVYKMTSSGWKRIKDTTATTFTDSDVSGGRTETYTLRCIDKNGNTVSGFNSKGWSKKYTPVAPTIKNFQNTAGGVKITWDKVTGAYGYRVYAKTSSGWKRLKDTTSTSITDSSVTAGQTKTYTIRCIDKKGNTVSGYNSTGWSTTYKAVAPTVTKLTNTSKGVSVTWNKVAGVYGYRLYRKYDGGSWTKVKDTTSTLLTDSGAKKGKKVTYTVRCIDKNGKTISGYNSKGWSITRK